MLGTETSFPNQATSKMELKIGDTAPSLTFEKVLNGPKGSKITPESFKGKIVIVEFFATWCGACIPALNHLDQLAKKYLNKPLFIVSVTDEEEELPKKETRRPNFSWDTEEIDWKDGISPIYQLIIKPIKTAGAGVKYLPGSNRLTADGVSLNVLIQAAYNTDDLHIDYQLPQDRNQYRVSVVVPKGFEDELRPTFQVALRSTFGFQANWESQEKEVLVLRKQEGSIVTMKPSISENAEFWFGRGTIFGKKQKLEKLVSALANFLGKPVVDETGFTDLYDWDFSYQAANRDVLIKSVKENLGLDLVESLRPIQVLVVEPADQSSQLTSRN